MSILQKGAVNLEIATNNVRIEVPKNSLDLFNDDLYFRLVPVKERVEQQEIEHRAKQQAHVKELVGSAIIEILGRPMKIETNMHNRPVTLTLPLPAPLTKEQLDNLAIFIEHSDGTKEVIRGNIVDFDKGLFGLQFVVTKFSAFSILYLPENEIAIEEPSLVKGTHTPYIRGYADGTFRPNANVTRAQLASMMARNLTNNDIPNANAKFTDTVTHDAKKCHRICADGGVIQWYDSYNI